ncbi:hypothetical protein BC939DRAFT_481633 [Gamsiella multidivaricata]|uniref:uncharacterized protein n=1 Tax=Gamsiella multidivaricata TaxID=101098 RepID=UPI00221FF294|nr:uncharacterized protein BC939DRAFT_481633 [Gamsiella multidivaricata]KAI7816910.1 hypothetical protein BC939DRAFT_481633 [Gamsiella multidivaricata]
MPRSLHSTQAKDTPEAEDGQEGLRDTLAAPLDGPNTPHDCFVFGAPFDFLYFLVSHRQSSSSSLIIISIIIPIIVSIIIDASTDKADYACLHLCHHFQSNKWLRSPTRSHFLGMPDGSQS